MAAITAPVFAKDMRPTAVRWRIFLLMLALIALNYVDRASLSVAMPMIGKEFHLDPSTEGILLSSFFFAYAAMQIPGGFLADRYKPRLIIAAATFGWGLFQALAALSTNSFGLFVTRLGLGVAEAPIYPAGGKLNAIWMTRNERARGATLLDGGAPLGAALGALIIAGLIAEFDSWRMSFAIAGIGTVLCGAFAWWYIRNDPRDHPAVNEAEARFIAEAHGREDAEALPPTGGGLGGFFLYRSVWCMGLGWMFFNVVFYGLLTWMPTYLYQVHGLDIKQLGGSLFIMFFAGFVGELVGGQVADFWRMRGGAENTVFRTIFSVAAIVATASLFLVAFVESSAAIVALLSATLFFLRWCGMYWAIPSILGSRARSGFLGGFMNLCGNIAGMATPIIVGAIVQATGSYFLALMFFAGSGVALVACSLGIDYRGRIPI
ncbi:MAG TPA: MFS transporter [Roseiarcus sp.]|nr:MFS transporter [Roseiarcus sp.]